MPVKAAFYDVFGAGFRRRCIGSERDPHRHSEMRRMLSPAFSQRHLLEQESIIGRIIDRFVGIIGEKAPPESSGINMTKWFEMSSFDILGEMAFGESFHSLEAGACLDVSIVAIVPHSDLFLRKTPFLGRSYCGTSLLHHAGRQPQANRSCHNPVQIPCAFVNPSSEPEFPLQPTTS